VPQQLAKLDEQQLDAAIALYLAGRPIAECCAALRYGSAAAFSHRLHRLGIRRTIAQCADLRSRRWAARPRRSGPNATTMASRRRNKAKWRDAMIATGRCGWCGKPRERLRYRCDACQLESNITAVVYRYRRAGAVITRAQAAKISQPGRMGPKRSKFKQVVARVTQVEVGRPAAVRQAFASL
jgi:hypothetical protein